MPIHKGPQQSPIHNSHAPGCSQHQIDKFTASIHMRSQHRNQQHHSQVTQHASTAHSLSTLAGSVSGLSYQHFFLTLPRPPLPLAWRHHNWVQRAKTRQPRAIHPLHPSDKSAHTPRRHKVIGPHHSRHPEPGTQPIASSVIDWGHRASRRIHDRLGTMSTACQRPGVLASLELLNVSYDVLAVGKLANGRHVLLDGIDEVVSLCPLAHIQRLLHHVVTICIPHHHQHRWGPHMLPRHLHQHDLPGLNIGELKQLLNNV
mmetsp:Transcript_8504/g.13399  ORF Transcript_8504/g.13399 Transcript_8504/m.13399 type:complete len:259 (+) Transcript_8504:364-1140(+)